MNWAHRDIAINAKVAQNDTPEVENCDLKYYPRIPV